MKKIVSLLLCVIIVFSTVVFAPTAAAAEICDVQISGKYYQAIARGLLANLNAFRTNAVTNPNDPSSFEGDQAWAWAYAFDKNNQVYFYKQAYTRGELTYDYELEEIAMQRAAEIAVYYAGDHTRPNGSSWRTAHTVYNESSGYAIGENIFAVTNCDAFQGARTACEEWLESNEDWYYQSHRRNILGVEYDFTATALACFEVNEVFYWVELFRTRNIKPDATEINTQTVTKTVSLNKNFVKNFTFPEQETEITTIIGDSFSITPQAELITTNHILSYVDNQGNVLQIPTELSVVPTLKSSDSSILSVSGNTVNVLSYGTATITATIFGKSITYTVTAEKKDLSSAEVTLTQPRELYIYSGEQIKPAVAAVTIDGVALGANEYSVSYGENVEVGTGYVHINGIGHFAGSVTKTFGIILAEDCPHERTIDPAIAPTCITDGKTQGTYCSICGAVFTASETLEHNESYHHVVHVSELTPDCTNSGCSAYSYCEICKRDLEPAVFLPALGHDFPDEYTTTKASYKKNGSIARTCTRCGVVDTKKVIYAPKSFKLSKTEFLYNGKVQKPKLTITDTKGNIISTAHYSYSIPNGKNVGRYKITIKFKGSYYTGTIYTYYDILPKNTGYFAVSAAKKAFKAKWKTQKVQTTGYQIQYSLYSNFKSVKTYTLKSPKYTAATISKLASGKKYYVRFRTYRAIKYEGKKMYLFSPWSKTKAVKTK